MNFLNKFYDTLCIVAFWYFYSCCGFLLDEMETLPVSCPSDGDIKLPLEPVIRSRMPVPGRCNEAPTYGGSLPFARHNLHPWGKNHTMGLGVKGIIEMFEVLRSYKDCDCLRKALHYTKVNLIKSLSRVLGVCGWRDGGGLWKLSSCNTVACGE